MHCIEEQVRLRDTHTHTHLFAEAVFAGIAMRSHTGATPMLPDINALRDDSLSLGAKTQGRHHVSLAVDLITRNLFQVEGVFAVRGGRDIRRLPICREAETVVCWRTSMEESTAHPLGGAPALSTAELRRAVAKVLLLAVLVGVRR